MASKFPQVRINLVEQKGWEPWDSGGVLAERASDAAYEDFGNMDDRTLIDLLKDMAGEELTTGWTGPKEWSPRKKTLSDEDFAWLASEIDKKTDELEDTRFAITDALAWMYEEAMTPSDGDIRDAIHRMIRYAGDHYEIDEELWEPLIGDHSSVDNLPSGAISDDLSKNVEYQRAQNHYDRYLVFYLGEAELVEKLLATSSWPKKQVVSRLKNEFKRFQEWYMDHFWDALHKEFDDVDISNRTNWRKHWKDFLGQKDLMESVRREMVETVKKRGTEDA